MNSPLHEFVRERVFSATSAFPSVLYTSPQVLSLCRDRDFNLNTRLNVNDDLLHHLRRRIQIDQPLVDPHLKHIPCLASLTTGSLSRRDLEGLCREADRALDAQVLGLRALEELGAHFFEGGDLAAGEGDADFVDFLCQREGSVST